MTSRRLWLGFGILMALLVLFGVAVLLRLSAIDDAVREQMEVAEPRNLVVHELETNILGYSVGIRSYRETDGSEVFLKSAIRRASLVESGLVEYRHYLPGDSASIEMSNELEARWRALKAHGATLLIESKAGAMTAEESGQLFALRRDLEQLLNDRVQPDATARKIAGFHTNARNAGEIRDLVIVLLTCGSVIGALTSTAVRHAVVQRERRIAESAEALREAGRRKDEFLAMLAHELRNPLAPIAAGLRVLELADDRDAVTRTLALIKRQVTQLVRLVDDLMDVGRISRGRLELRCERVSLAAVIESAIEATKPLIDAAGHRFTAALPAEPVMLEADLTRLAQVFVNLLSNAARYTNKGGQITLSATRDGNQTTVAVRDSGIGIAPERLAHIFDPFSQSNSQQQSRGGLGVGLSLAKRLVEMHGGTIVAQSEGPRHGSEFCVRLPIAAGNARVSVIRPDSNSEPTTASPLRILIVDDNEDGAASLASMLRLLGNDVRTAGAGRSGLDEAARVHPDVMLLDIGLPDMDGYEVCRRIRREPWGTAVLLIALTGWGQDEDRRRSREAGFDYHVVKPLEPDALQSMLAQRCGRYASG